MPKRSASTISSVEPLREVVQHGFDAGVQGRAIHAALKREHGFTGSYSAVVRMLQRLRQEHPPDVTVRLSFTPGDAAQVDFGADSGHRGQRQVRDHQGVQPRPAGAARLRRVRPGVRLSH